MNWAAPVGHAGGGSVADRIQRIDHIGIVVSALEPAVSLFHDTLGGRFLSGGDNEQTGIRLLHLALPGLKVELLQPLREDSLVSPFLTRKGSGFHHLTLFVDDVPTTVDTLEAAGVPDVRDRCRLAAVERDVPGATISVRYFAAVHVDNVALGPTGECLRHG